MKNKGITLISLVITIIVILILVTVTVYNGANTVKSSKFKVFEAKLKIMQSEVNSLYDKLKKGEIELTTYGKDINSVEGISTEAFTYLNKSTNGYRYYDRETIEELKIDGVEGETYFVNLETRSVISYNGFEYDGTKYYELSQFVNSIYNVDYEESSEKPTFDVSVEYVGNDKSEVRVYNIQYEGSINKWYVKYGIVDEGTDEVSTWYTSEEYTFDIIKEGTYKIKIVNGNIESDEYEISNYDYHQILSNYYRNLNYEQITATNTIEGSSATWLFNEMMENTHYIEYKGGVYKLKYDDYNSYLREVEKVPSNADFTKLGVYIIDGIDVLVTPNSEDGLVKNNVDNIELYGAKLYYLKNNGKDIDLNRTVTGKIYASENVFVDNYGHWLTLLKYYNSSGEILNVISADGPRNFRSVYYLKDNGEIDYDNPFTRGYESYDTGSISYYDTSGVLVNAQRVTSSV